MPVDPDCEPVYARSLVAGAEPVMEPMDMKHAGERYAGVRDPAGTLWWIATHGEDVSPEQQQARIDASAGEGDSPWS